MMTGRLLGFGLVIVLLLLAACDPILGEEATPEISLAPSLAPSATVLPFISPQPSDVYLGRSEPTAAALAAEGQPSFEPSLVAEATEVSIPITVITDDGVILQADYFGAPVRPAPTLLVLHGEELNLSITLSVSLQAAGYNVMLLHQRGYPPSSGQVDWSFVASDTQAALETIQTLPDASQIGIVAQGRSAIGGLQACKQDIMCTGMVMIDPLPDDLTLPLTDAVTLVGELPLLIVAGEERLFSLDMGQTFAAANLPATRLAVYPGSSFEQGAILTQVIEWLEIHLILGIE